MTDMAAERKAHQEREAVRQTQRMAASCLYNLGAGATREECEASARERWNLIEEEVTAVGDCVDELKSEGGVGPKHLPLDTIQEEEKLMQPRAEKIREATREVLKGNPKIKCKEAWEAVVTKTGATLKASTFEVSYFYVIRKELRESGELATPAKKAPSIGKGTKKPTKVKKAPYTHRRNGQGTPPPEPELPPVEEGPQAAYEPMSNTEIRLLRRLAEVETEAREIETALIVIRRLKEE